jgi:hypothetical protein
LAEDEEVDVADRTWSLMFVEAGGPGTEDERFVDPLDGVEFGAEDDGRSERLEEHVGESGVIGTVGVGSDEAKVPQAPAHHQSRLLGPLDLSMHGGVRELESLSQGGEGQFESGVTQYRCEDFALLA